MKKTSRMVLIIVLMTVFAWGLACGIIGAGETTLLDTRQAGSLTKGGDIVPLNSQSNMLQFRAGGHILGFQPTRAYLASLDHALSVEFLQTKGVMPQSTTGVSDTHALAKAPALTKVSYENLWKGINLTYETAQDGITESTYHIAPNVDVSQIRLRYNVPVKVQKDGSLKFTFERGYLTESKPVAWQDINGKRIPVPVAFNVTGDEVGFSVGTYNPREPLIIDPTYAWHTFYGSSDYDNPQAIAIDTGGNVYVTGRSDATWGTPLHAFSGDQGDQNSFVLKLNSSGAYQWHAFYGTGEGNGIAVDTAGNVYVTGSSYETWGIPLHEHSVGYADIFVLKLNSSGAYQWHTFYGSTPWDQSPDQGSSIAVDTGGNIYVTGWSRWTWGTPLHAYSGNGGYDIFVLKLNSGGAYQWNTFYGSSEYDYPAAIAVDTAGNVYVTGSSYETWGTPLHSFDSDSLSNFFVLKLNSSGAYQWNTFYRYSSRGIAVDTSGNVYVTGYSNATWGTPLHAFSGAVSNTFVLKLNSSGAYQWNTFYTGTGSSGIAVDTGSNVYVTGSSAASWGTPLHPYEGGVYDICILKLNSSGAYLWHTFYGSIFTDHSSGIAVDTGGNVYVAGTSGTWGTPLNPRSGDVDIFVLKLVSALECSPSVKVNSAYFNTIQDAYNAAANGNILQISAMVFNEDILLNRDITTVFSGGYDCGFDTKTGFSTVDGTVTIKAGSVTIDGLIIK
ncbi:MAG: hypothetical protein CVU51_03120 [Deltaproteobacteria bacterium HGW-Deltaproteobacteria-1]|jgi:hypothetical protein|nr:MAG: hypothetical protein CVU51_03120 [Deltaproteobacteria bacterium HGW-Deltaproteobacteria-1]